MILLIVVYFVIRFFSCLRGGITGQLGLSPVVEEVRVWCDVSRVSDPRTRNPLDYACPMKEPGIL